jgi:serine protease AprX
MHVRHWGLLCAALVALAPAAASIALELKSPDPTAPLVMPAEGSATLLRGPDLPGVQSSPYADLDRNRIFDTLDVEMADKPLDWQREVIVMLLEEPTPGKMTELKAFLGGFPITSYKDDVTDSEGKPWTVIPAFAAMLTKEQILTLSKRAEVQQIEPVVLFYTQMNTAKDETGVDKAVTDFGVNGDRSGGATTYNKDDIVACVIDTGIRNSHVDLDGGKVIGWKDYVGTSTTPYDDNGHGTHVAATIAGTGEGNSAYKGVATGAALVGVKVLNSAGSGSSTQINNGINWCKDNKATYGIEIMSLSLGGGTCTSGTDSMSTAVNNAWNAGIVVLVAAGNSGPGYCTIGDPGAAANVITVGAGSDPDNAACSGYLGKGWYLASFSSRGLTGDGRYKPDIWAPGVCITSAGTSSNTAYVTMSGTSMATPFAAGVVALMLDADPTETPASIKSILYSTSEDWGPDNQAAEPQSYDFGAGRVQAYEAVKSAGGYSGTGPSVPNHYFVAEDLAGTGKKDRFDLQVTSTGRSISITLIIPSASGTKDFDIRLYNPSGSQVATSLGTTRQETISYTPTATGKYTVQVESYAGSGSYWIDVSAAASSFTISQDQ